MLQEQALKGLSMQDAGRITPIFRDVASRDDMPVDFRERAIKMLNWKGSDDDFLFLRRLYTQVDEASLKETIVMAVGDQKSRETREWLLRVIRDADSPPEAREKAFFWAGEDKRVSTEELVEIYGGLEGGEARKQAVHVIGQRKDKASLNFLLDRSRHEPHPEARRAAIFWLGQSDDPRAVDCLEEIIGR
jgi:HEAT repeat protein